MFVDALCMQLVRAPEQFEVIVSNNMFGDILTDLGAALQGGLGVAGSANLHPGRTSMFEPVHGSAPKYAGTGRANPIGAAAYVLRAAYPRAPKRCAIRVVMSCTSRPVARRTAPA